MRKETNDMTHITNNSVNKKWTNVKQ